jgi:putative phage-type endonuclease
LITERQRQLRNQGVGASECAAILGLDPYRSAYDLYVFKSELHEESADRPESEAQTIGNLIEPTTAALAEQRLGCRLVKPTATYKAANGVMFANLDRQVERAARGADNCELKSTGLTEGWGDDGTDQIPDRTLVQVTAQMVCSDARVSHVARLLGRWGFSFSMYRVGFNERLAQVIEEEVLEFWKCVEGGHAPKNSTPSLDVISHVRRTPGKVVDISAEVIANYRRAVAARKEAEVTEDQSKAVLLAALGDAEVGKAGNVTASFRTIETTRFDAAAFKAAHPDLHAQFVKPSGYRRLDVKESKA